MPKPTKTPRPLRLGARVVCETNALAGADIFTPLIVIGVDADADAYDVELTREPFPGAPPEPTLVFANVPRADLTQI